MGKNHDGYRIRNEYQPTEDWIQRCPENQREKIMQQASRFFFFFFFCWNFILATQNSTQ